MWEMLLECDIFHFYKEEKFWFKSIVKKLVFFATYREKNVLIGERAFSTQQGGKRMDDLQIIELYFDRNEKAIKETEVKYGKLCFSIANNILNNEADTEECVNDTYLSVWNTIPPQRPNNFMAFICKITRNISLKRIEFNNAVKRSAHTIISLSELEEVLPGTNNQPEIEDEQLGKLISDFLRSEKEDARNVFIRKYWYFDTIADIATRYSFSEGKVKSMLFHTRNRLKDYLKKEDYYL